MSVRAEKGGISSEDRRPRNSSVSVLSACNTNSSRDTTHRPPLRNLVPRCPLYTPRFTPGSYTLARMLLMEYTVALMAAAL
jgi:hypothetical protein